MMIKERGPDRRHNHGKPGARRFARPRRRHESSPIRWTLRILIIVLALEFAALLLWPYLVPQP